MNETCEIEIKSKSAEDDLAGKAIKRKYWLIAAGVVAVFSGYNCILALQSSIHIENGLGSKLTTITYTSQICLSFFLIPFILRLIGAKRSLLLAESAYILYVVANAFSNNVVLIIGALAGGLAEGLFWLPIGISFIYFAKKYAVHSSKTEEVCVMEFSGIFFFMFQLNPVVGNITGMVILNFLNYEQKNLTQNLLNQTNSSFSFASTTAVLQGFSLNFTNDVDSPILSHVDHCGANDCQDAAVIDDAIDNYVPTNQIAIYILSGFFVLLMMLGLISHVIFVPEMSFSDFNKKQGSKKSTLNYVEDETNLKIKSFRNVIALSFEAMRDTIYQFFDPYQLFFITPYTTYSGMKLGFVLSEATRAYGSCLLGVNQVGICLTILALVASLHCFLFGRFYGKRGRVPLLIFEVIYDISLYTFLLLWKPTEETKWISYGLFVLFGIYKGTNEMIVANIFGCDFYKSKEISFNLWCIVFAIGISFQCGISTHLCVRDKIYICMVWIVVGVVLQLIFEIRFKNKQRKVENKEKAIESNEMESNCT